MVLFFYSSSFFLFFIFRLFPSFVFFFLLFFFLLFSSRTNYAPKCLSETDRFESMKSQWPKREKKREKKIKTKEHQRRKENQKNRLRKNRKGRIKIYFSLSFVIHILARLLFSSCFFLRSIFYFVSISSVSSVLFSPFSLRRLFISFFLLSFSYIQGRRSTDALRWCAIVRVQNWNGRLKKREKKEGKKNPKQR